MHGEYKVPQGKLVVVDLESEGDRLRNVRISGDFFLYPDDALESLTAALEDAPAGAGEEAYRGLIAAAVPPGTEMVGFSPEAIAVAVVRAQQGAAEEGS